MLREFASRIGFRPRPEAQTLVPTEQQRAESLTEIINSVIENGGLRLLFFREPDPAKRRIPEVEFDVMAEYGFDSSSGKPWTGSGTDEKGIATNPHGSTQFTVFPSTTNPQLEFLQILTRDFRGNIEKEMWQAKKKPSA